MRKLLLSELGRLSADQFSAADKLPIIVVLDNIRSAMNIGSVFRSCDAFLIEKVILTGICARPPHKEILKTAIGASQTVLWEYRSEVVEAVSSLKSNGFEIIGVEQTTDSISLQDLDIKSMAKMAFVFGNEVNGISDEVLPLLDRAIEIDQFGTKHSLNISVCAGIVLWYTTQQIQNHIPKN